MFEDMVARLDPIALKESPITLNVATLCSGTEAPIFGLNLIQDALEANGYGAGFEFEHLFSCEIEPFKQGFIRRNLPPGTLIFRDVVELASAAGSAGKATTAGGSKAAIPAQKLDILFAGCSCVDYSNLNQSKPSGCVPTLDRHLKQNPKETTGGAAKKRAGKAHDQESTPVKLDEAFVEALDRGLEELHDLPSGGESTRTFFAAIKLITVSRPKLIILENVYNAPWDMYTDQIFPKICYVARMARLDSKDFYLPQTRQRGYLVAADATNIGVERATAIVDEWAVQILRYKRPPSAPITAFLRPVDDPATIQARADMESKSSYSSEWALCSLRHADARQKRNIHRDDNPFSKKAMRNGRLISTTYPSHAWLGFWNAQVPRIIDLIDIAFAALHQEGVDGRYKTGMIDVSQNVDRNEFFVGGRSRMRNHLGIVGCITPTGMPIITDLMRPVTGTETLALQGLPVDKLVISTETQAQLRDLAGNAMTVTVVGTVTLVLLLAASKTETNPRMLNRILSAQPKRDLYYLGTSEDKSLELCRITAHIASDLEPLDKLAKSMVRLCYCPTPANEIVVCNDCGVTACPACRGNPKHCFGRRKPAGHRLSAEQGKLHLRDKLPHAFRLPVPGSVVDHGLGGRVKEDLYRSVVCDILKSEPVYYYDEIKVTEAVTVCYKAANSIARLVLSTDTDSRWYIYIAPWHPRRTELSRTFDLDQPIARGQLPSRDLGTPRWSVWAPGRIDLDLRFSNTHGDGLHADSLSFARGHDAASDVSLHEWKRSVEAKVCGTYAHLPDCGTAGNLLHVNKSSATHPSRVFLMWESARLRNPDDDHFVWTSAVRRMEPHEYREILLHAQPTPSWEIDYGVQKSMRVFWPGYWSSPPEYPDPSAATRAALLGNLVQLHWGSAATIQQASCHTDGQAPATHMPPLATMTATFRGWPGSTAQLSKMDARRIDGKFYIIPATGCEAFLRTFAFVSSELRRSTTPEALDSVPHLTGEWVQVTRCRDCSVTPPEITVYTKKDERKSSGEELKLTKAIIEDPDKAAMFERKYQDLPRALAIAARLWPYVDGTMVMDLRLMLQPKTLASRALAYLLQAHPTAARGCVAVDSGAETSFTVVLNYAPAPVTGFAPFAGSVLPCGEKNTAGIDLASECSLPDADPPRFRRTVGKERRKTLVQHTLRPSQTEAVNWMLQRERAPLDFVKSEIEEEVVSPLNLRVVGKAEWTNPFPYSARGGVVAHEIGYGKTVVTLGLIDCMRKFDKNESIVEREDKVDGAWAKELPHPFELSGEGHLPYPKLKAESFFCHLSATLVVVPKHITDQWENEAAKFLGLTKPQLLVIKTTSSFYGQRSLEELGNAEIIIVSSAVFGAAFLDRLQIVAGRGSDYPKGLSGRTLEAWYRGALRNQRILTAYYLAGHAANTPRKELMETITGRLLPGLIEKQQADIDALVEKQVAEIDRKYYKKTANKAGKTGKSAGDAGPGAEQSNAGPKNKQGGDVKDEGKGPWAISWLHNCSFARIIWDECSYDDDDNIHLFVANAVANAKWLLSGTPKLFGLEQVCKMAAAFGVHVARPEPRMMPGLPAVTKGPELNPMSKSEQFHVFSSRVKSAALAHERHSHAHTFVAAYFRANALDAEVDIEFQERVLPISMETSDSVRYHLLSQEILDAGYDYTALPAHARDEVALKGIDLAGKDGSAAAKMLLGLLACGLGRNGSSIDALTKALETRRELLSDQMKFLWDKTMWLWHWIRELKPQDIPDSKLSAPVQDTLRRVESMCGNMHKALLGDGNFEEFGGMEMFQHEAAAITGLKPVDVLPDIDSIRAKWGGCFQAEWAEDYSRDKALHIWLDFFEVETSTLDHLTKKQLCLLAKDVCWLKYKIDPNAAPFHGNPFDVRFLGTALAPGHQTGLRTPLANIEGVATGDIYFLEHLNTAEIKKFIQKCVRMKPETPTWQTAKADFKLPPFKNQTVKGFLQTRLTELNLKFSSSHSTDTLKEMLWRHEEKLAVCEHYRDGRAPPDRHQDLEVAISRGGPWEKQIESANEELKRTMVHLAKTVEDWRATSLEANFVPEYALLANAPDKHRHVRDKLCGSCRGPLRSAPTSFLVVACGHLLCGSCKSAADFYCPVKDCRAFIHKRPVLQCSQVPLPHSGTEPRAKAEHVARLINEFPKGEFVVVFAQYRLMIDALARAFTAAGLEHLNLATVKDDDIARQLEDFKMGKAGQILLLDMDSETSAGSNLTIATRVVFANPYVHHDQEHQTRTVRQAKGRCIRTGQTKKVRVYHLMVPGTIEEETLRQFGRDSPAVQAFFDSYRHNPWWMDE
ncbi:hypothetical protein C8A01DRAFT_13781 [Parachaetomium inaequale]|uniref:RING-type domain-containing protein n=1 Tax=Parachaetomium inaequale TaxID=2588326 RepID=A0AAN6PMK9_9PEZI|nr:hypothetical protein C8A01DRAFT_13781 [Parachaetomium inaequale]